MPRVPDEWLNSVVYLYPSEKAAKEGTRLGASAFIVVLPSDDKSLPEQLGHYYIVTNKHVVPDKEVWVRINKSMGGYATPSIAKEKWVEHKTADLKAAYWRFDDGLSYIGVNRSMMLTPELQMRWQYGPGDEVFLIGRYIDVEGKAHNVPTVRTGVLSAFPAEPILNNSTRQKEESILVEVRALKGFSGSPVFVTRAARIERSDKYDGAPIVKRVDESPCYLLGVNWGYHPWREPILGSKDEPVIPRQYIKTNSGMAMVVPAEKLLELLDDPRLVKPRREMEIKEKKLRAEAAVGEAASADESEEFENFEDLTQKLVQVPKSEKPPTSR